MCDQFLDPIYESEFARFSYGFRPGRSAHVALGALTYAIVRRKVDWIIDADIEGYFDSLDRERLMSFLAERIGDRRALRLIRKWLNAGVVKTGVSSDSVRGTPQGAPLSPLLASVYLHNVLDSWFAKQWRPTRAGGELNIVRYADDFVLGFQYRADAERFLKDAIDRFKEFGLSLNQQKTRLNEFGKYAAQNRRRRGKRRPSTFDFLGFTHSWGTSRNCRFLLGRKPIAKRVRLTLEAVKQALRLKMHDDPKQTGEWLARVLQGWLICYAVPTSCRSLKAFRHRLERLWLRELRRRSQKDRFAWGRLSALCNELWPPARILHPWPHTRFAVKHSS